MTDSTLISRAAAFAARAHAGQTRRGSDTPYYTHVEAVARRVQELCEQGQADPAMVAAAYLHDTMEDCGTTHDELTALFGSDIADLVAELTNDDEKKHRMGKETYMVDKLSHLTPRALTVKLCDTLSNISDCPTPTQAATYASIQRRLQAAPPATWNNTHAQLSSAIIKAYEYRFDPQKA
ncbi:MAG: HD domain-containing protein [Akkermansia sp.]|nr:HD domain-containing protein [Akkermansia sp.]